MFKTLLFMVLLVPVSGVSYASGPPKIIELSKKAYFDEIAITRQKVGVEKQERQKIQVVARIREAKGAKPSIYYRSEQAWINIGRPKTGELTSQIYLVEDWEEQLHVFVIVARKRVPYGRFHILNVFEIWTKKQIDGVWSKGKWKKIEIPELQEYPDLADSRGLLIEASSISGKRGISIFARTQTQSTKGDVKVNKIVHQRISSQKPQWSKDWTVVYQATNKAFRNLQTVVSPRRIQRTLFFERVLFFDEVDSRFRPSHSGTKIRVLTPQRRGSWVGAKSSTIELPRFENELRVLPAHQFMLVANDLGLNTNLFVGYDFKSGRPKTFTQISNVNRGRDSLREERREGEHGQIRKFYQYSFQTGKWIEMPTLPLTSYHYPETVGFFDWEVVTGPKGILKLVGSGGKKLIFIETYAIDRYSKWGRSKFDLRSRYTGKHFIPLPGVALSSGMLFGGYRIDKDGLLEKFHIK